MTHILIVEDHEMNRDMLSRRLKRKGFDVSFAFDGLQSLSQAKSLLPDLILMDIGLPYLDGWEATRRLKANPTTQHIPIIALTAHAFEYDREKSLSVGCDEYETKPINWKTLLKKMHALLGNTHS
jgi:CheY-like chemotaxis protein